MKVIGGVKGFKTGYSACNYLGLQNSRNGFYVNARSALYALIKICKWPRIWIPSYICDTVLKCVTLSKVPFEFYPVGLDLISKFDSLKFSKGDAILLVNYFGVPVEESIYEDLKTKGLCIVEDLSQGAFSMPNDLSNFAIYSPRKFFAVPDGGVVISKAVEVNWPYSPPKTNQRLSDGIEAIAGRSLFNMNVLHSKEWVLSSQKSEAEMDVGLCPMSLFSRVQLISFIDFEFERNCRIRNFDYLSLELKGVSLIKDRRDAVPLAFPIVISRRDEVRKVLFNHDIYPAIHWNIEGLIPAEFVESHQLSKKIMSIPCDGNYDIQDMKRIVDVLKTNCCDSLV